METWIVVDIERITKEKQLFQLKLTEPFNPHDLTTLSEAIKKQLSEQIAELLTKCEIEVGWPKYTICGVYGGNEEGPDYGTCISAETYKEIVDGVDV